MKSRKVFLIVALVLFSALNLVIAQTSNADSAKKRPKVGLVLSGGGAKGIAHIGVLKVLEEAGIRLDYITGTSMGSIIGGLYAIGYNSVQLDSIVSSIEWNKVFSDELPRNMLSMEEKSEDGRFIVDIPVKDFAIALPKGLVAGHKLSLMLTELMLPASSIKDFSKLPIPYACIAADLVSGKAVVLDKGYLAQAVRASMAIPTIVTPVEIEGKMLVDGGIIRNLPVQDVIDMGAEFIIGVDVGAPLRDKQELNSFLDIMDQVISFRGDKSTQEQRRMCDILITPDITGISGASFDQVLNIIKRGEDAARPMFPKLKTTADSINSLGPPPAPVKSPTLAELFYISEIKISGVHQVSEHMIRSKLLIEKGYKLKREEIVEAVNRVYGTRFFESVNYRIISSSYGDLLEIIVVEKVPDVIKVGLHYDSEIRSSLLLNTTFRNVWFNGSKLMFEGSLGENPILRGSYYYYTGWRPDVGLGLDLFYSNIMVKGYEFDEGKIGEVKLVNLSASLGLVTVIFPSLSVTAGVQFDKSYMEAEAFISLGDTVLAGLPVLMKYDEEFNLAKVFGALVWDTYDRTVYPRRGIQYKLYAEYVPEIKNSNRAFRFYVTNDSNNPLEIRQDRKYSQFLRFSFDLHPVVQLQERISLSTRLRFGLSSETTLPLSYSYFLGGIVQDTRDIVPFYGLSFLSTPTPNYLLGGLGVQFEPIGNIFLMLNGNVAHIASTSDRLINFDDLYYGYGVTFGLRSPIGPIELAFVGGNHMRGLSSLVNIGYKF